MCWVSTAGYGARPGMWFAGFTLEKSRVGLILLPAVLLYWYQPSLGSLAGQAFVLMAEDALFLCPDLLQRGGGWSLPRRVARDGTEHAQGRPTLLSYNSEFHWDGACLQTLTFIWMCLLQILLYQQT